MHRTLSVVAIAVVVGSLPPAGATAQPVPWTGPLVQLTHNNYDDRAPEIHNGWITWQSQVDAEDWEVMYTPEPSTALILALAGAPVFLRSLRRRGKR